MIDTQKIIDEVKKRLVKTYNPLEIYLFGSYAHGIPDEESDLDLLVVVEKIDKDRHKALVEGHRVLMDLMVPKDIILYTKEEFDQDVNNKATIIFNIKKKGKQIYARA